MKKGPFKICPNCGTVWQTLDLFLADPELELAGYQVAFRDLKGGLFYFTHHHADCGTTLAIPVAAFTSLSTRPFLNSSAKKPDGCPDLCVRQGALEPCQAECECLWVREIMQIIKNWKK